MQRVQRIWQVLILLVVTCWLWLVPVSLPVLAQAAPATTTPALFPEKVLTKRFEFDPNSIPSEKVSQFVHACLQVVALIERREGELQGAETESESLRIEQEIEAEALAIIEQAGLTRQEYLQLLGLANTDPEFGERIATQLQEATS